MQQYTCTASNKKNFYDQSKYFKRSDYELYEQLLGMALLRKNSLYSDNGSLKQELVFGLTFLFS